MKRWLRRGGIALGVLVLLIVAFYVEENWRGARLWAQTKAEYEAKGFNFDPKSLIPPPVPDEQNFAKSKIWLQLVAAKSEKGTVSSLLSSRKLAQEWRTKNKAFANWQLGRKSIHPPLSLFASASDEIEQLYAAANRPHCQLPIDLSQSFPADNKVPELGTILNIAQALAAHASACLDVKQTASRIKDISTIFKVTQGCSQSPYLISGLVMASSVHPPLAAIWDGIESHQWFDTELAQLQSILQSVDLLQVCQLSLRSELLFFTQTMSYYQNSRCKAYERNSLFFRLNGSEPVVEKRFNPWAVQIFLSPSGWFDCAKTVATSLHMNYLDNSIDPLGHRFFPGKLKFPSTLDRSHLFPPFYACVDARLPSLFIDTIEKLAQAQTMLDLAQVACGLERYWLANKKYPAALAELEPKYINKVPHDICTGEPLHYRVNADGNYTLYSVGFNGVDDGGQIVMKKESQTALDPKLGDWVWPRSKK